MSQQAPEVVSALAFVVIACAFDIYCLKDLARAEAVLYFPPQVWFLIIVLATPLGGISYLMLGRQR